MSKTIYLCGHGSWDPNDGYFNLPKGCTMTFIVHHAKCLYTNDMYKVCEGTWTGAPLPPIQEFKSCPNMLWTVDEPEKKVTCETKLGGNRKHNTNNPAIVLFPSTTKTLKTFFEQSYSFIRMDNKMYDRLDFVWNCCTYLNLKPTVRGGASGVNAAEAFDKYDYIDFASGNPLFLNKHMKK